MKYRKTLSRISASLLLSSLGLSASAQIFYQIEGNGLENPSYLFGTHHLAPLNVVEENNVMDYFDRCEQVIGEIDLTQDQMSLAMKMQPYMMAPQDSTLSMLISAEDYAFISDEFKKWAPYPGMELSMLEGMRPMVVSTMVSVKMISDDLQGFDLSQQLDTYFQNSAKEKGKDIVALETPEFQAEMLYGSTPIIYQAEMLVELLKNPEKSIESVKKLNTAYANQDLDTMFAMSEENDEHPEFMEALLDRRNTDWLIKLPDLINNKTSFIAVGALHLAGDKGLIEGLRRLGYTVTPVIKQD